MGVPWMSGMQIKPRSTATATSVMCTLDLNGPAIRRRERGEVGKCEVLVALQWVRSTSVGSSFEGENMYPSVRHLIPAKYGIPTQHGRAAAPPRLPAGLRREAAVTLAHLSCCQLGTSIRITERTGPAHAARASLCLTVTPYRCTCVHTYLGGKVVGTRRLRSGRITP